jgi:protein PhnA
MTSIPTCPRCTSIYAYESGLILICPECAHEWTLSTTPAPTPDDQLVVKDAFGNTLVDGDTVSLIKDLKIKGASGVIKVGTRVKNIRIIHGDHNIDCRIDGLGEMKLKSEFVKKA